MQPDPPELPASVADETDLMLGRSARERLRLLKDRVFAWLMAVGGIAVLIAILLIFFYLFYVVLPLFEGAEVTRRAELARPGQAATAAIALDEYAELALDVDVDGGYRFLALGDGTERAAGDLLEAVPDASATALATGDPHARTLFVGTDDGRAVIARADYAVSYPDDQRLITPSMSYPLGAEAVVVDEQGQPLRLLAGQSGEEETTLVAVTADGRTLLTHLAQEVSFLDESLTVTASHATLPIDGKEVTHIAIDVDQRELFVVTADGVLTLFDIYDKGDVTLVDRASAVGDHGTVTALDFLSGGISVIVGDSAGGVTQWFPVRDENNVYTLARVREFPPMPAAIAGIAPEHYRKGFAAIDVDGNFGLYHATAGRRITVEPLPRGGVAAAAMSPRASSAVIAGTDGALQVLDIDNDHPEVSFQALWGKVWYESRAEPEYIWQSSSASSDFEPKYSLTPLTFGTLKATFYSMLFAMPLAVLGAIYTAYFMTPTMRAIVKPSIEVMAALPTVILGFLAGLWFAPLVEQELLGFFLSVALVPLAIVASAWLWMHLPRRLREAVPDGWEALLLIPVIFAGGWLSLALGSLLEVWFFGGSLTHWMSTEYGITYDQRNSLVVGVAIGFAVIPTIFSISEDAVFSVPRSLTMGSLALGATPWQTAIRVVLLTASPGIFSAIMIGMGRAVGETMIVLMATGNTPIMDLNIFQGFRALSANIAVEMPESEVASTHYRILFLAALVLFLVTFLVNTAAELVRQRLRRKYASL